MQSILIVVIASIIGVVYLSKVRSYDIYEKEPFFKLLFVAIFGGVISIIFSLVVYGAVEVNYSFTDAFIKVGLIEEASKLFALAIIYYFIKRDFNEIVDGIIYITAISLGFAIIENVFYASSSETPFLLLFQRSIFSVVGHISFSGYMGIAFYIHKRVHKNYLGILLSLVLAAFAHGFYDGVIFQHELSFLFKFIFIGLIMLQIWMLRTALSFSAFRKDLAHDTFEETENVVNLSCSFCNKSITSNEFRFWNIKAGVCKYCNHLVLDMKNVKKLIRYFRPGMNFQKFYKLVPLSKTIVLIDKNEKIAFNTKTKYLSADVAELSIWLKENNVKDRNEILKIPFIGFVLKHIGLRFFD